jgi:signal transduction histidine kinase
MKTIDQKYQKEIEVERLWAATGLGKSGSLSIMPFYFLIVTGLWDQASHTQLLGWLLISCVTNLFRWSVLHFYRGHKLALANNVRKFKNLILMGGVLIGLNWVLCFVLFQDPANPANLLITCFPPIFQVLGTIVTWFSYFPAVVAVSIPPTITLIYTLLQNGGKGYLIIAGMFSILPFLSYLLSVKLSNMLDYALVLNFENAELRRESEEKSLLLETSLENMSQGISMSDKDDRLRMWNSKFVELLGEAGSLVRFNMNLTSILEAANPSTQTHLPDNEKVWQVKPAATRSNLQGKTNIWSKYRLSNGQIYEIRQSELTQGGRVLTYTDITEQVKHEEALERARRDAEQANAAKTRFLAAASHDLRQPIHALGLFFADLSDRVKNSETEHVIGQVEDAIEAINSMLNALLDVSKLDAGILKPSLQAYNLQDLFERLNHEFQPVAAENRNRLKVRATTAAVQTDPAMLERMLRNLISNALRYTTKGRVLLTARPRGNQLEIKVFDTGLGIPLDKQDEIFIEFHQLHNSARDRRQGLGLGLAIVKRLANLLHYNIKVQSVVNKGSCFTLTLPLALRINCDLQRPVAIQPSITYPFNQNQVLIVDDDASVIDGMKGLLSRWGCIPVTANSLEEAMAKISMLEAKLDLMIVDYRLPDMISGISVARTLQQKLSYPVPVLIITGDTGPERLQEADASGFPLLHKPVQPAKLRATLNYLLNESGSVLTRLNRLPEG